MKTDGGAVDAGNWTLEGMWRAFVWWESQWSRGWKGKGGDAPAAPGGERAARSGLPGGR